MENLLANRVENNPLDSTATTNVWGLLGLATGLSLLLVVASQYLLMHDELIFNAFSDQLAYEQIQEMLAQSQRWAWVPYVVVPLLMAVKFLLVSGCISLGYYFATNEWVFRPFVLATIRAEFILLIPGLVKLIWFLFIQTNYTLQDLQLFYPLSLLNLVNSGTLEPYLLYPLQVLNLFEVAYWFALAYGVARVINASLERGFGLVMASYGSGLALWVVFVMFLSVSLA